MNKENNKIIIKNTSMLYIRMIITMIVSLYTVRIVLNTLGAVDFGIYSAVAGIVTSFSFLSGTLAAALQRFFAFDLGCKNYEKVNKIFSLSLVIYGILSFVIFLLAESIGLWFLKNQLNVPENRIDAAIWIYQFSIFTFIVNLLIIPYNSLIIAHEKMSVYAYTSIIEAILKLTVVYILVLFTADKLKTYAVLIFFIAVLMSIIYRFYCKKNFVEASFKLVWDRTIFKEISTFSSWNLFGSLTTVSFDQGLTFMINIYFGPIVSASRAISSQVNNAVSLFSSNFYTAIRPQIIKYYAELKYDRVIELVFSSTKYSYYMLYLISIPILLETNYVLYIWLGKVPIYTVIFVRLAIIFSLQNSFHIPITTVVQASGDIRKYQIVIGLIMLCCLPVSYFFIKLGFPPEIIYYCTILTSAVALIFRLRILKRLIYFSYLHYFQKVLLKIFIVTFVASILPLLVKLLTNESLYRFIFMSLTCLFSSIIVILYFGLENGERNYIMSAVRVGYKKIVNLMFLRKISLK